MKYMSWKGNGYKYMTYMKKEVWSEEVRDFLSWIVNVHDGVLGNTLSSKWMYNTGCLDRNTLHGIDLQLSIKTVSRSVTHSLTR